MHLPNKNKINIYIMLVVTLSLAFVSTFGFVTHKNIHKKPKRKAVIHNLHKVTHNLSTKNAHLSTEKMNKRLLSFEEINFRKMHIEQMKHQREVKQNEVTKVKSYVAKFEAIITSYTAGEESTGKSPGDVGYGITTSGKHVQEGITLSCPPSIPLGTWVKIEDIGKRRCDDRGAAIKQKHFDLYVKNLKEAIQFGVQIKTVYILRSGS